MSSPLPEAGHDPSDPNQPDDQLKDAPIPPVSDPTNDMDMDEDLSSELSDVDEAQFAEFDPNNIAIEDRPQIAIDEDTIKQIGRFKRTRPEGEADGSKKKKKEGRRPKPSSRKKRDGEDNFSGGEEVNSRRQRASRADNAEAPRRQKREETPDEDLDPETRRRRALDRAIDAAIKKPNKGHRRKRDGIVSFQLVYCHDIFLTMFRT
jgi:transcription factor SPN1